MRLVVVKRRRKSKKEYDKQVQNITKKLKGEQPQQPEEQIEEEKL